MSETRFRNFKKRRPRFFKKHRATEKRRKKMSSVLITERNI
jgi:hypothetical protein